MFSRISRYRDAPDVFATDAAGRVVVSKQLRLLPAVSGRFEHVVEEGARLDDLANRYYRQPRKWWRICDANPEFISPFELLGRGPLATTRLDIAGGAGGTPPAWDLIAAALARTPGVERHRFVDEARITAEAQTIAGKQVNVNVERHVYGVVVAHNDNVTTREQLFALLTTAGFSAARPVALERVGERITIPPDIGR
jgi:hypothetical protein